MLNISIGVPGIVRVGPASGCPDPTSLPQIQFSYLNSLQLALADAIQTPPPMPGPFRPGNPMCLLEAS